MQKTHIVGLITFLLTVVAFGILFTIVPKHQSEITSFTLKYPFFAPIIIIFWRIIAIIIPPLPGGVLSFAFIPIIGWFGAYAYGEIGVIIGASLAFFIARRFREPAVARFVPLQTLHVWEDKLSKKQEFFAFLGIRLAAASVMDFLSYAAGLSKISFKKFILATIIAELPVAIWYYFGEVAYKEFAQKGSIVSFGILIIAVIIIYYFVKNHGALKRSK